ncbi:VOC family protein [Haloferax volcanii]|uniref:VOC family protein n=1 Tax=Haloferax volcanii TaxID=2246 RepID=UPI003D301E63
MKFTRVALAATDPISLCEFYVETLGFAAVPGSQRSATAGETTLWFELGDTDPGHLAFTVAAAVDSVVAWLDDRADVDVLDTDEGPSVRFDFLGCDSVYFEDPEGNVIEYVCYDGDAAGEFDPATDLRGVTEVGMAVPDVASFVASMTEALGIEPLESFEGGDLVFVGDRDARFVVSPVGRPWYPTDSEATVGPVSAQCDADGVFDPEGLPYRVNAE